MRTLKSILAASIVLASPVLAHAQGCTDANGNGSIGVFTDLQATSSCFTIPVFTQVTMYVIMVLGGDSSGGITGAEFRLEFSSLPAANTFITWTPNPAANLSLGTPLDLQPGVADGSGSNIAFPSCQGALAGDRVLLGTLQLLAVAPVPAGEILVKRHSQPSSPNFYCPLITQCDPPVFSKIRLTPSDIELGREAILSRALINTTPCNVCTPPPPSAPLGIYANASGTDLELCAEENVPAIFHLIGVAPTTQPPGITGAEFRIEVENPAGYAFNYAPPAGASAFGSPFDLTPADPSDRAGTTVLFSACQPAPAPAAGRQIDFGTISVLNFGGTTTALRIRRKLPAESPTMLCPRFFLCDNPLFSPQCMGPALDGTDLVFEAFLNTQPCLAVPFLPETVQLDAHEAANDGAAGPISTNQLLDRRKFALVTVDGTASLEAPQAWISPPATICGLPERAPLHASPSINNHWVGVDAEATFAAALPAGADCSAGGTIGHHARLEIDSGAGFVHVEPLGGTPPAPFPGHRYRYLIQGRDHALSFRFRDTTTSDDYGVFVIHIEEAQPADVFEPQPNITTPAQRIAVWNAPDPFNPTTRIHYALRFAGEPSVRVFDVGGRLVRRLSAPFAPAGAHSLLWDGRNDSGHAVPSGVYVVRIETAQESGSERLTLVR